MLAKALQYFVYLYSLEKTGFKQHQTKNKRRLLIKINTLFSSVNFYEKKY